MKLQCPECRASSIEDTPCPQCGFVLQKVDGILRALAPSRRAYYQKFLGDYGTIRMAEGRGSHDREYYLALPYQDRTGKNTEQWRIRARTEVVRTDMGFVGEVLQPDVDHLIELMLQAVRERDSARRMGAAGAAHVAQSFTWDRVTEQLVDVLQGKTIIAERPAV